MWIAAFYPKSSKKSVVIESSILESVSSGFKGLIKKIFISRISLAYVSGQSQKELLQKLHFKGRIIITKGVGIFNVRPQPQFIIVKEVSKFIYVGRLSPEKNLRYLIETLNELPYLSLSIIGYGPQESFLRSIAGPNIIFYGAVPNAELYKVYQSNDVFILPSISEPWGMVVEEAINNGLPVIVSDRVGCGSEIINENNGIIYNSSVHDDLKRAILKMLDIDYYNSLRHNISKMNFEMIAEEQVRCYL
jgi:glycosyltransferase involved in cell wall biosynthesis